MTALQRVFVQRAMQQQEKHDPEEKLVGDRNTTLIVLYGGNSSITIVTNQVEEETHKTIEGPQGRVGTGQQN